MRTRLATTLAGLLVVALAGPLGGVAVAAPGAASAAASGREEQGSGVLVRPVVFDLVNDNGTTVPCVADGEEYTVRGRLVGPHDPTTAQDAVLRVNVLVHDAGTGGWFWNLREVPGADYATRLARRGETTLVIDRLGYDRSPLPDGHATCLGAQAHMLHQVVQHLRSGLYRFTGERAAEFPPHASHVVVHGHGTGATIAQLEAAEYDDTAGLVLMSAPAAGPRQLAVAQASRQLSRCMSGDDYAPFGASPVEYRRLLFASAGARVRVLATRKRNPTPCGDVTSLPAAVSAATLSARRVEVPVLVLTGERDARVRPVTTEQATALFANSSDVSARVLPGAGSALPLEAGAGKVRRTVLRWLARR